MQHTQSIDTVKPRGSIRQGAGYATAPGFARCLSPEREHSDPQTANRVRQNGACCLLRTLSCFDPNAKDAPIRIGASFHCSCAFGIARVKHLIGMHSESPGSNTLSACFRVCRIRTQCQHAFGITRAERHAGMHSHLPEPNGTPASQARPPSP